MRNVLLLCIGLFIISATKAQFLQTTTITDWDNIWQSGFVESVNAPSAPSVGNTLYEWYWGVNIGHSGNNSNYKFNGQILVGNNNIFNKPIMYFRSTDRDGFGTWAKVIHDQGDQKINGSLNLDGTLIANNIDYPIATISDWNQIWKSGFYQSNKGVNSPEVTPNQDHDWYWGINIGHSDNKADYRYNGQILIANKYATPSLYFRSTDNAGFGIWAKVLHDQGEQKIKGNLAVAGKIDVKEIQVKVDAGADHVFGTDYKLINLSDLKSFVEENKHLPDIPSEKQMRKEGLNVNEFQIKLLQKIEELTLYMIKQQDEINELKLQIKK